MFVALQIALSLLLLRWLLMRLSLGIQKSTALICKVLWSRFVYAADW
jgi:hypothetical protein